MKRRFIIINISLILLFVICTSLLSCAKVSNYDQSSNVGDGNDKLVEDISEKIIRFHVIANSDTDIDQSVKIEIKNKILDYMAPKLEKSKSIEESREILKNNDNDIKNIAKDCLSKEGFNYGVSTELGREDFPVKTYGDITLPQGNYEAYRVILGNGKGKNWWCVMFPPLCFIDITKGEAEVEKTDDAMKNVLNDKEYNEVNKKNSEDIQYKFKVKEFIDSYFK